MDLSDVSTPFGSLKTAEQYVQFANDPSRGLTRGRYHWFSNGTRFDDSNFEDGAGEIDITVGAGSGNTARLSSAFAGQYASQSVAKPGLKTFIDDSVVEYDERGQASLKNGDAFWGPMTFQNGSVQNGFGIGIDTYGLYTFWISGGLHQPTSPRYQRDGEWQNDPMDGTGASGIKLEPSAGMIYNFPYTWYNAGRLNIGVVYSQEEELKIFDTYSPPEVGDGRASLEQPNLPVQAYFDSGAGGESIVAAIGGMEYALYGVEAAAETRPTYSIRRGVDVSQSAGSPVDPISNPGVPLFAVKRQPDSETLEVRINNIDIDAQDNDIYLYIWDVYDDAALTGENFEQPIVGFSEETRVRIDESATAFDASNAGFKRVEPIVGSDSTGTTKGDTQKSTLELEDRLPLNATRVVTAVTQNATTATVNYVAEIYEGF